MMEAWMVVFTLVAVTVSFLVSASAGLGGSLILVPALALALGTKEGVALAALLLAANNVVKVIGYRKTLPFVKSIVVMLLVSVGAWVGARLLELKRVRRVEGPVLAFASGATSGFSGTSGPLKGMALRQLDLDRAHFVGAASLVSLAGDATKAAVFTEAGLVTGDSLTVTIMAIPLMLIATFTGRRVNFSLGERGYSYLFWAVMAGYTLRLAGGLVA
jgi:uncharacterized membrane protein YfcA